jgi:hypothetical protein
MSTNPEGSQTLDCEVGTWNAPSQRGRPWAARESRGPGHNRRCKDPSTYAHRGKLELGGDCWRTTRTSPRDSTAYQKKDTKNWRKKKYLCLETQEKGKRKKKKKKRSKKQQQQKQQ